MRLVKREGSNSGPESNHGKFMQHATALIASEHKSHPALRLSLPHPLPAGRSRSQPTCHGLVMRHEMLSWPSPLGAVAIRDHGFSRW